MDVVKEYGLLAADVLITWVVLAVILWRVKNIKVKGIVKGLLFIAIVWGVADVFDLTGVHTVAGTILQYALLGIIVLYPYDFKVMMSNYGRKRWGLCTEHLLSKESQREVVKAVATLSKEKRGCLITIATRDGMDDVIQTGKELGSLAISSEVIESFFRDNKLNKGALVIKDNRIVSVNSQLPIVTNDQLNKAGASRREYAGLGAVYEHKAIALIVNAQTGKMSMMGSVGSGLSVDLGFELKERNIQAGVSEDVMVQRLQALLNGSKNQESVHEIANKPPKKKAKTKEERLKEREEKRQAREQVAKPTEKPIDPTKRGRFFG